MRLPRPRRLERLRRDLARIVAPYPEAESLGHHLGRVIRRLGVNCVLDVGAHIGQYASVLRTEAEFTGHIVSFEPCASSYRRLIATVQDDRRWRCHPYALGSVGEIRDMNVFSSATNLSSFLEPNSYGSHRFPAVAGGQRRERVAVHRLADVFDEVTAHVPDRRVLLKLDTQGYDLHVLKGAEDVLGQIVAVQTELSSMPIYDQMPSLTATLDYLEGAGFLPTGMFPVTCDDDDMRVIEFDCVCVADAAHPSRRRAERPPHERTSPSG
jgi:FkbM family methyltransferase